MKYIILFLLFLNLSWGENNMSIYNLHALDINNKTINFTKYKNKIMLIVNVASKCGYTYQYEGLQKLYEKYQSKGLSILGFPSNQFLSQEPGTEKEIENFCKVKYGVTFDMFSKINVNGQNTHPLYKYLKKEKSGFFGMGFIKWNFTKFLIDKNGIVQKRYSPSTNPKDIEKDILNLMKN